MEKRVPTETDAKVDARATIYDAVRPRLFGLAYRMLGSRADAEDAVQDAWIKWHDADRPAIDNPEAWLVTVMTRLCIDRLRYLRSRREVYPGPWLPEPYLGDSAPDAASLTELSSDLSLAFLVALERLGPEERAAFLLREVFDFSYGEIAGVLGKSEVASRQVVSRARTRVREDRPRFKVEAKVHRRLVERFVDALAREDSAAFVAVLAEDVSWTADGGGKVSATSKPIQGPRAALRLAMGIIRRAGMGVSMGSVNGQPGVLFWHDGRLTAAMALETDGERVRRIYSVVNPDKLGTAAQLFVSQPD